MLRKDEMSKRESEVAELVAKGLSNKEVAHTLFVTEKTVKFHLTNIYKKLQMKSRSQLIVWFAENRKAAAQSIKTELPKEADFIPDEISPGIARLHSGMGTA